MTPRAVGAAGTGRSDRNGASNGRRRWANLPGICTSRVQALRCPLRPAKRPATRCVPRQARPTTDHARAGGANQYLSTPRITSSKASRSPHGSPSNQNSIGAASIRTIKSAWCAASSATCPRTSGSTGSPRPASTAGKKPVGNSTWPRCGDDAGAKAYAEERVGQGQEPRAGNLLDRRPPARPGLGRRAQRQDAAVPGRRIGRSLCARGGPPATSRRAPIRSTCRPTWPRSPSSKPPTALVNVVRLAHYIGKLQDRIVPVSGFVGSPAHCWSHWFLFPPLPKSLGGHRDSRRLPGEPGAAGRAVRAGLPGLP